MILIRSSVLMAVSDLNFENCFPIQLCRGTNATTSPAKKIHQNLHIHTYVIQFDESYYCCLLFNPPSENVFVENTQEQKININTKFKNDVKERKIDIFSLAVVVKCLALFVVILEKNLSINSTCELLF